MAESLDELKSRLPWTDDNKTEEEQQTLLMDMRSEETAIKDTIRGLEVDRDTYTRGSKERNAFTTRILQQHDLLMDVSQACRDARLAFVNQDVRKWNCITQWFQTEESLDTDDDSELDTN